MRIITGRAKSVPLKTLPGEATRPTVERVKESVFSMLQFELEGRCVLDLFAGSGQLGLEAVSRGAASAVLADASKEAIAVIRDNVERTKLSAFCRVVHADALQYLRQCRDMRFDIVFLDPPYASELYAPVLQGLLQFGLLKPTSIIVCESDREDIWNGDRNLQAAFSVRKSARYGKVQITVLEPAQAQEGEEES